MRQKDARAPVRAEVTDCRRVIPQQSRHGHFNDMATILKVERPELARYQA